MQQRGQGLDCPRKVQLVNALEKERPNTRPLERTIPGMSDSKVSSIDEPTVAAKSPAVRT